MRTIPSQDPTVRPVRIEKTFDKVRLGRLVLNVSPAGTTNLTARFDTTDGQEILTGNSYLIRLPVLETEENISPRLTDLLDRLTGVLGLYYKREVLKEKIGNLEQILEPTQNQIDRLAQLKIRLTQVEHDLSLTVFI